MISLVLFGAKGRMGQEIARLTEATKEFVMKGKIDPDYSTETGNCFPSIDRAKKLTADVAIEFTHSREFSKILDWCVAQKVPLVSGTTGLLEKEKEKMAIAGKKIPILWSPNMSLGINFVIGLLAEFKKIPDFDIEISETHHSKKKDKPSGTALWMKEEIENAIKRKLPVPQSLRMGGVYGEHNIFAANDSEEIIITHRALNREVFAKGALAAAKWLQNRKPGVYKLKDLLTES